MVIEDVCPECGSSLTYDYACEDIENLLTKVHKSCVLCNHKWTQEIQKDLIRIFSNSQLELIERILVEDIVDLSTKLDKLWEEYEAKQAIVSKIRKRKRSILMEIESGAMAK